MAVNKKKRGKGEGRGSEKIMKNRKRNRGEIKGKEEK